MKSKITLIIILTLLCQDQAKAGLRTIITRLEALEVSESKLQLVALHIAPSNNSLIQAEFHILQDLVSSKLKLSVVVLRCLVGEAPDTCEYLINLKPPNACFFANAENMAWNLITDAFTPKLRCPLKKGKYVTYNATFDSNKWDMYPLDKWHFQLTLRIYEGDEIIIAMIIETHIVRIR